MQERKKMMHQMEELFANNSAPQIFEILSLSCDI